MCALAADAGLGVMAVPESTPNYAGIRVLATKTYVDVLAKYALKAVADCYPELLSRVRYARNYHATRAADWAERNAVERGELAQRVAEWTATPPVRYGTAPPGLPPPPAPAPLERRPRTVVGAGAGDHRRGSSWDAESARSAPADCEDAAWRTNSAVAAAYAITADDDDDDTSGGGGGSGSDTTATSATAGSSGDYPARSPEWQATIDGVERLLGTPLRVVTLGLGGSKSRHTAALMLGDDVAMYALLAGALGIEVRTLDVAASTDAAARLFDETGVRIVRRCTCSARREHWDVFTPGTPAATLIAAHGCVRAALA